MKIAIGFFGLPRCSQLAMPSIEEKFIRPLQEVGEVRLFHHLYLQKMVLNLRSGEDAALSADNYGWFTQSSGVLEPPDGVAQRVGFDEVKPFGDFWGDGTTSLMNLMLQLHSLSVVTAQISLIDADVVIFLRPDLVYHDKVDVRFVEYLIKEPRACLVPNWQCWGGYNDRFALCGKDVFRAYGNRLSLALTFCETYRSPLHAEQLLRFALRQQSAKVRFINLRASRVRVGGELKEECFDPKATWGEGLLNSLRWGVVALRTSLSSL